MEEAVVSLVVLAVLVAWVACLVNAVKLRQVGWVVALILFWPCALAYVFVIPAYREREQARLAKEISKVHEGVELRAKVRELELEVARLAQVVARPEA